MKKIILNAGGTGGHFFPAIALGEELLKRGYDVTLVTDLRCKKYLTSGTKFNIQIIDLYLKQNSLSEKMKSILKILAASLKALILLFKIKPNLLISFGGYPTTPSLVAAVLLRIPIVLHEQNCTLGKTNKFFSKFARIVALSYAETNITKENNQKILITGDLVRENIKNLKIKESFDNEVFRIFIFGGSQSAKIFSSLIPASIREALEIDPTIKLHITQQVSRDDHKEVEQIYSSLNIEFKLAEFFHNIADIYLNSELVISRAGAGTIAELTTIGLPAIFIPFPYAAGNHQFFNAQAIALAGGGWCMQQSEITSEMLARKIIELATNRQVIKRASEQLLLRKTDGINRLAVTVEKII